MTMSSDIVEARSINGTKYLLVPKKMAKKIHLKDGQKFVISVDGSGIQYKPVQLTVVENVELEVTA